MTTVRQIAKSWDAGGYDRLILELLQGRPEQPLASEVNGQVATAALALLRLDELAQAHVPLYTRLLHVILAAQGPDGGWADPMTTALCLRALFAGRGQGWAIERGLQYMAHLQKAEGAWPRGPIRRMAEDAFASAFILLELGGDAQFRSAVRFDDATAWLNANEHSLDDESRQIWECAKRRLRVLAWPRPKQAMLNWC